MTAPRPRPFGRDTSDPDRLLERLLILADQWRSGPVGERRPIADELVDGFTTLADTLAAGGAPLPSQWAGSTPAPPELPPDGTDAEVEAARVAVTEAEAALAAAEAAVLAAHNDRETAARAVGEARKRFYDLARVRDLSRP